MSSLLLRHGFSTPRPSKSASALRRRERERLEALTDREKMVAALRLGQRATDWLLLRGNLPQPPREQAMGSSADRSKNTLEQAQTVARVLQAVSVRPVVIGALALAVHGYVRYTNDLDLATDTDPFRVLPDVVRRLLGLGLEAELHEPDAQDSLGGMVSVTGEGFDEIQIVNFYNPFRPGSGALATEAIRTATITPSLGEHLPVVDLPHLVALKLYAGGRKSELDVLELLDRNPQSDGGQSIREVCERFGLHTELAQLFAAAYR